jgi:hypothetical protein
MAGALPAVVLLSVAKRHPGSPGCPHDQMVLQVPVPEVENSGDSVRTKLHRVYVVGWPNNACERCTHSGRMMSAFFVALLSCGWRYVRALKVLRPGGSEGHPCQPRLLPPVPRLTVRGVGDIRVRLGIIRIRCGRSTVITHTYHMISHSESSTWATYYLQAHPHCCSRHGRGPSAALTCSQRRLCRRASPSRSARRSPRTSPASRSAPAACLPCPCRTSSHRNHRGACCTKQRTA